MPTSYEINIKRSAEKEIKSLSTKIRQRVIHAILNLAENPRPRGCEKLSQREAYRIRVGRYRIVYSVFDRILVVEIVRVAHRKEVYR
ncbi:MAG: type II toxin-antitoxin system RelE/ParE family toxin [Myxococcota bacterium]|nr:type II toxin-antitoxin system RelE/ParE family toxin [Myxococcota bacterium]